MVFTLNVKEQQNEFLFLFLMNWDHLSCIKSKKRARARTKVFNYSFLFFFQMIGIEISRCIAFFNATSIAIPNVRTDNNTWL